MLSRLLECLWGWFGFFLWGFAACLGLVLLVCLRFCVVIGCNIVVLSYSVFILLLALNVGLLSLCVFDISLGVLCGWFDWC